MLELVIICTLLAIIMILLLAVAVLRRQRDALLDACEHSFDVFDSMADRGCYPKELMPDENRQDGERRFLGKQGFEFLVTAIQKARGYPYEGRVYIASRGRRAAR